MADCIADTGATGSSTSVRAANDDSVLVESLENDIGSKDQAESDTQPEGERVTTVASEDTESDPSKEIPTLPQDEATRPPIPAAQYILQGPPSRPHDQIPYYHDPMQGPGMYAHPQAGYMSNVPNPPGTKAKRKRASPHQLALLGQIFEYTFFPSTELRNAIGMELGMAPRTVQIWFQNRRQSWKAQKNRDGSEDPPKSSDNERGGWEVLRSFQARRAAGEIHEYEYMSIPAPGGSGPGSHAHEARLAGQSSAGYERGGPGVVGPGMHPYPHGIMQVALSSNDQFNSSMQQLPIPLPHHPHPNPTIPPYHPQILRPAPTAITQTTDES